MKTKTFSLTILSILSLMFLVSAVSAVTVFSDNFDSGNLNGWVASGWTNTGTHAVSTGESNALLYRTISTDGYENIVVSYDRQLGADWEADNNFTVSWSVDGTTFTQLEKVEGNSNDALPDDSSFLTKTYNLPASAEDNPNFQLRFECSTDAQTEFCNLDNVMVEGTTSSSSSSSDVCAYDNGVADNPGDLEVKIKDISVTKGFGDDNEWLPLDNVEVEFEVKNRGDYDISDISLEWGITDNINGDWLKELDEVDSFRLRHDKDNTYTVDFTVDERDLDFDMEDFEGSYTLYARATGTIDDNDAGSLDNVDTCASDSEDVSVEGESDFVILENIDMPDTVSCGDSLPITAKVWNIGDNDQDDVTVKIFNKELGITDTEDYSRIDSFSKEDLLANLQIPDDATEKTYIMTFEVYDDNNDIYVDDYNDDESRFTKTFTVANCAPAGQGTTSVAASLVSGGEAGQPLVVRATITNTGTNAITYSLNAAGYAQWASSADLSQSTLTLNAGSSADVTITFNVKDDASGTQSFNLEVLSDNQLVTSQPVSVSIEGNNTAVSSLFAGNTYLWVIGILNVILVIIIIIVAIRLARR